jgi:hypothetical protein
MHQDNDTTFTVLQKSGSPMHEVDMQDKVWIIVSQVKSHRLVYFTDDLNYRPPTEGDWYHISQHRGQLPAEMTLKNCWGWRYRGMEFIDARDKNHLNDADSLMEHNKKALHELLQEKIKAIRRSFAPTSIFGDEIRQMRLNEARKILEGQDPIFPSLIRHSAQIRGISLQEMARRTVAAFERQKKALIQTEMLQDQLMATIDRSTEQAQLLSIREQIISDLAPEINENYKIKLEHTTPQKIKQTLTADEITQERIRLTVALRLKINEFRHPYISEYLLDDMVMQHKVIMAEAVIANRGQNPKNQDILLLISHAAARQQTLLEAAHEVLTEMNQTAQLVMESEQMKDAFLAKISMAQSAKDFEQLSQLIHKAEIKKLTGTGDRIDNVLSSTKP